MVRLQDPPVMSVGGLAEAAGVGVETIRFYQRRGLLGTPDRSAGPRRYTAADLRRLRFIRRAQGAGFTLEEIGELLELDSGDDHARARALARHRIALLDARIAELERARAALSRLADACAHQAHGPCPILEAFDTDPEHP